MTNTISFSLLTFEMVLVMLVLFYSSFMNKFMYCILVDRGDYTNVRVHILLDYIFVYGGKYFFRLVLVRSYRQTENKNSRQF